MKARFLNGYLALGALMLALPMSAAISSTVGKAPTTSVTAVVASAIMPESTLEDIARMVEEKNTSEADVLFRSDWGAAHPEIYSRIAMAFDTEAMNGADLMGVECRASLCKVSFQTTDGIEVRKLLPMQLANSFHSMVTVHAGGTNHVYVDIPRRG